MEKKFKEHEDFYAIEVADLKEALDTKVKEAENLEREAADQYAEGFDKAIKQVKFLFDDLDLSSCGYFNQVWDGMLVDKPLPGATTVEVKGGDQVKTPDDVSPQMNQGEDQVDDSPAAT